ncbi:MAG TPA: rhomboid family intramembrane serine protease, partial [Acidobacteriota bacterium]|nr:rhomboid family intramembrane serine protease [Acidobacteriota bacterium]
FPNRVIYLYLLFPVKVKWLVVIMGAIAFLSSISGGASGVAHFAHLSGMIVGYLYLRGSSWGDRFRRLAEERRKEQLKRQFELYYGDVRRKVEKDKKKDFTVH